MYMKYYRTLSISNKGASGAGQIRHGQALSSGFEFTGATGSYGDLRLSSYFPGGLLLCAGDTVPDPGWNESANGLSSLRVSTVRLDIRQQLPVDPIVSPKPG